MSNRPPMIHRLLIIAYLAMIQLFAPLVHAHAGQPNDSAGLHVHLAVVTDAPAQCGQPTAHSTAGVIIDLHAMRREHCQPDRGSQQPAYLPAADIRPAPSAPPALPGRPQAVSITCPSLPACGSRAPPRLR